MTIAQIYESLNQMCRFEQIVLIFEIFICVYARARVAHSCCIYRMRYLCMYCDRQVTNIHCIDQSLCIIIIYVLVPRKRQPHAATVLGNEYNFFMIQTRLVLKYVLNAHPYRKNTKRFQKL